MSEIIQPTPSPARNPSQFTNQSTKAEVSPLKGSLEIHAGPIPHPNIIAGYENVLPGSAERILRMAEEAQTKTLARRQSIIDNRHSTEMAWYWLESARILFLYILVLSALFGGIYLVLSGQALIGAGMALFGLAPQLASFLRPQSKRKSRKD